MQSITDGRLPEGLALVERGPGSPAPGRGGVAPAGASDVSLLRIVNIALRHRALVLLTAAAVVAAVAVATRLAPRTYSATAQFMPQSRRGGSNLSGLAAQFGVTLPGGEGGESGQFYAGLIGSRDVVRQVAAGVYEGGGIDGQPRRRAPLSDWLEVRTPDARLRQTATEAQLRTLVSARVAAGTPVVSLRVRTSDPAVAQQIADRMLAALDEFNRGRRQSQAAAEREFTGRRLDQARAELRDAETRLQRFLDANRGFGEASALRVEQDRLSREVALRQQLYGAIAQSYEQARIEEVRDTPVLTVIERTDVPVHPDPQYLPIKLAVGGVLGLFLGLLFAVARDYLARGGEDPADARGEFSALRREMAADLRHPLRAAGRALAGRGAR